MTARSSPHHAAVVRAQVRRRAKARRAKRVHDWRTGGGYHSEHAVDAFLYAAAGYPLRDRPKTEAEKDARWRALWQWQPPRADS